jgi:hypothetical protein
MIWRLTGWWYRWQACKMAAQVVSRRKDVDLHPKLWSLAVFFESYMVHGAEDIREDFGPDETEVVTLTVIDGGKK